MIREVYLNNLPKWEKGGNKGRINWYKSIGHKVEFHYGGMRGSIEILSYDKQKQRVLVKYNNNSQTIKTAHLKTGAIGNLLGLINHEFSYKKGEIIKVSTGNIEILDQISMKDNQNYNIRGYKYKCLNDGYIGEVSEYKLKNKVGCSVCNNKIVVKGMNDLATTHSHLLHYFTNKNDAYENSYGSIKKTLIQCPNCKYEKSYSINKLTTRGFACRKCGDGISYPEKFVFNFLEQLNVIFEIQKVFNWSGNKQYDFYLPELNLIIETHGLQHYQNNYSFSENVKLLDIKSNDNLKYELSLKNNIDKYIVLDCRKWEDNWIKNSIENSELVKIIDISKIDWVNCHMFACSSRVKEACNLWNEFSNDTKIISEKMKLSRQTVIKYLKQGNQIGWCEYDPKKNMAENGTNNRMKSVIPIVMYDKNKNALGVFQSAKELSNVSIERFGIKLNQTAISAVCRGEASHHKGYTFKYFA